MLAGLNLISSPVIAGNDPKPIIHDDLKRTFNIHVPSFYDNSKQYPLVLALHGRSNGLGMSTSRRGFNTCNRMDS
jgi:poly(3-hydroxybutyrate) depolymerase